MPSHWSFPSLIVALVLLGVSARGGQGAAALPNGVRAVWDLDKAWRETTPTRERVCINGLWRWQPAKGASDVVPTDSWGFFKVPGSWPGITDYMQKDCQTVLPHPSWADDKLGGVTAAWYQREIAIPSGWAGRRIALCADYVNSLAAVYVDGKKVGDIRYPADELDLTAACRPGGKHVLSMLVIALPLKGVMMSYSDTSSARQVKGRVARRGLCGDVFLAATPTERIGDVRVDTSVRKGEVSFQARLNGLDGAKSYALRAVCSAGFSPSEPRIRPEGRTTNAFEFISKPFRGGELRDGRIVFTEKWKPERLWDIHTPQNVHTASVSLLDAGGKELDAAFPVRFGFREFWIDGRDFYLSGSRIWLSAVPLDNAQVGAAWASYEGAKESLLRLKSFGINFVYTHNYGCEPGAHLSFEEALRAADDVGMLVALSQPHFGHYDWKTPDADTANGYAGHAAFYARVAGSHPAVVAYSTSHNATGSGEDMNPDFLGAPEGDIPRGPWSANNSKLAFRAEAIIKGLDPSRIVYHHAGDIGSLHASNFYPNFVPIQEMSDWFETWAAKGVKPVFLCEYGAPFSWDWAMYRGWFKGKREFGSAVVPWEFCLAEWNAQFFGDAAFKISEREKANLRWEAKQAKTREGWHRWDYPTHLGSNAFDERAPIFGQYATDNWRAFRTWGLSANSPWEHGLLHKLREGVDKGRQELPVDWDKLQRPGLSPDYTEERYERMDLAFQRKDWAATPYGKAMERNNMPLLAYIAGKPARVTSKDHNFLPGETVEKQIVVINNSRVPVTCECTWSLASPKVGGTGVPPVGARKESVKTGEQVRIPLSLALPKDMSPGVYELSLTAKFGPGGTGVPPVGTGKMPVPPQEDEFAIHVLPPPPAPKPPAKIALFDPKGETAKLLTTMGVAFDELRGAATPRPQDEVLIIGKGALTAKGPGPDIRRVRDGLKVLVFEQTSEVLEQRLGFRVTEYGLRQVFSRVPDHPALAGLMADNLRDWRGAATLLPPRLTYPTKSVQGQCVYWCGIPVTRVWRCGNQGSVASVLIEKPACGDFLPIVDGGFSLQYSPLLECREGKGMVIFCQLDVTGRTESEPAAERLVRNLLNYVGSWKPAPRREAVYAGEPAGRAHLEKAGIRVAAFEGQLKPDQVLVVGPGGGATLAPHKATISGWLKQGGHALAIGLSEPEAGSFLPVNMTMKKGEYISGGTGFQPVAHRRDACATFAGIGPADVHNRDPRELDLLADGGVVGQAQDASVVFCQLVPWQFDPEKIPTRRTFRRVSCLLSRLLGNMGAGAETPLLARFSEPVGAGAAPSLLKNGDFSLDADGDGVADGWQVSGGTGLRPVATGETPVPPGGAPRWAQRLTLAPPGDKKPGTIMLAQHDLPMEKGHWYRISLRAKAEGMKGARVTLTVQNTATWRQFFDYQDFTPTESWKAFQFLVQSNDAAKKGTKFQTWHGTPGTLWLADLRMEPCDAPTQGRWLTGLYLDKPEEWDDPYRFFRW
ncbi:MAG: hypothetical protein FJ291_04415 [Planctomycetes bacterium]|nr:hypothetical protein [Planctomycetota bacterium]